MASSGERGIATKVSFAVSLLSGGVAGTTVDVALYPLDTIKTRLQSPQGFLKAGGFKGVYKGLGAAALGSAPGASLFFATYEGLKNMLREFKSLPAAGMHMIAASLGEVAACTVRVPTEVVKQRMQVAGPVVAGQAPTSSRALVALSDVVRTEGFMALYSGYRITIIREIPFSLIQFPLYEWLKEKVRAATGREVHSHEGALCGCATGGLAAGLTTPLDVVKTRMMLGKDASGLAYTSIADTVRRLRIEGLSRGRGGRGVLELFFSGVQPRVMWISIGGFVFFGAYERAKALFQSIGL